VDKSGNVYVGGITADWDFPLANAAQSSEGCCGTAFASKLDSRGRNLMFSTLWGPGSQSGGSVAVGRTGDLFLAGSVVNASAGYQTTPGAFQTTPKGDQDGFIARFAFTTADVGITNAAAAKVRRGSDLTYTIVATNSGPDTATAVSVTDATPKYTTFVSASSTAGTCTTPAVGDTGKIVCRAASLLNGSAYTVTITVHVIGKVGNVISDTASVSAMTFDQNSANNSAIRNTTIN